MQIKPYILFIRLTTDKTFLKTINFFLKISNKIFLLFCNKLLNNFYNLFRTSHLLLMRAIKLLLGFHLLFCFIAQGQTFTNKNNFTKGVEVYPKKYFKIYGNADELCLYNNLTFSLFSLEKNKIELTNEITYKKATIGDWIDIITINKKIYILSGVYNNSLERYEIYCTLIDSKDLDLKFPKIKVGEFYGKKSELINSVNYKFSPDLTKILFYSYIKNSEKGKERYAICVINSADLKQEVSKKIEIKLASEESELHLENLLFDNTGNIFIYYHETLNPIARQGNEIYKYSWIKYNYKSEEISKHNLTFSCYNKLTSTMKFNNMGDIVFVSYYFNKLPKDPHKFGKEYLLGFDYKLIDYTTQEIVIEKSINNVFENESEERMQEIIESFEDINHLSLAQVINGNDGDIFLLTEGIKTYSSQTESYDRSQFILASKIQADGSISWLNLFQYNFFYETFSYKTFIANYKNNLLYIFYNKSYGHKLAAGRPSVSIIDSTGNFITEPLFKEDDNNYDTTIIPDVCYNLNDKTVLWFHNLVSPAGQFYGILEY